MLSTEATIEVHTYVHTFILGTSYGLQSFRYAAPQVWNTLPDKIRTSESLIAFKRVIHNITVYPINFLLSYFINFVALLKYYYTRRY